MSCSHEALPDLLGRWRRLPGGSNVSTAASLPSASTRIASRQLQFSSHLAPAILLHHAGAKGRIPSPKIWVWPDRSLTKECEWSPGGADRGAATLFAWPPR